VRDDPSADTVVDVITEEELFRAVEKPLADLVIDRWRSTPVPENSGDITST
jgi:hypothetical protein